VSKGISVAQRGTQATRGGSSFWNCASDTGPFAVCQQGSPCEEQLALNSKDPTLGKITI